MFPRIEGEKYKSVEFSVIQWEWTLTLPLTAADMDGCGASLSVKYAVYEAEGDSARPNCTPKDPDQASLLDYQGVRLCCILTLKM